jgi:hypothetical protein
VITASGLNCILAPLKTTEPSLQDAEMMKLQVPISRDGVESVATEAAAVSAEAAVEGFVSWNLEVKYEWCALCGSFQC